MKKTFFLLLICALSFSAWGTTVVKTVPDLTTQLGWKDDGTNPLGVYPNFALDDNISVSALGTTNGTLSKQRWFTYQNDNNGAFTISAKEGYIIQSVSIVWANNANNGVLSITPGSNRPASDQITSAIPYAVNAQSATFYTGSSATSTAARITITTFAVTYCLASAIGDKTYTEKFDSCGIADQIVTKKFNGNNGVYKWSVKNIRRLNGTNYDELESGQGMRVRYEGYIASDGNLEGGIKAVAFNWHPTSGSSISDFYVKVGEESYHHSCSAVSGEFPFSYDFNVAKNTTLSIEVAANSGQAFQVIGPVTITPYLLYTVKSAEMWAKDGAYMNNDLINNIPEGGSVEYTLEDNDEEAIINAETGEVTALKDGEVTVKATWGGVYTTYTLKLHMESANASFDAPVVEKSIGDVAFTNTLTKAEQAGTVSYTSTDESVATVKSSGEVTIVNGGTAKIQATITASSVCRDTTLYYTLDVKDTPAEGTYWEETFSKCTTTSTTGTEMVIGDSAVYNWSLTNFTRNNSDLIGEKQGMRLRYPSVWTMTNPEGGIKEVVFDWYASGDQMPVHFFVKAGENEYEYSRDKVGVSKQVMHFARQFNETSNVALSLHMSGVQEDPQQTYAVVGPIKIVPYLLFRSKSYEYDYSAKQSLALSDIIINNTGITPSYAISGGAQATLSNGVVTFAEEEETFTITATWGDVSTTTNITVHALPHPTFTIADVEATMYDGTAAPTPVVKVGDVVQSNPVITYTSSDENIVKVENEGKVLSILAAGSVTITANLEASETYQAATTTFTLTVSGIQEGDADKVTEEYTKFDIYMGWSANESFEYDGDNTPYKWTIHYFQHTADMMGTGKPGIKLASNGAGYISAIMEGGIKAVGFDWMVLSTKKNIQATITAGTVTKTFDYTLSNVTRRYECALEQKSNVEFKLTNGKNDDIYGPITIVPYLLYTEKEANANLADETYINEQLINNTDEGDITYSIVEETDIAIIDAATGEVTLLASGTITVQAQWGDVTTSYSLTIDRTDFTPTFAQDEVTKNMDDPVFTNTLSDVPADATGAHTYSSSDERVAQVDNNGQVTILGIGSTTIEVTIAADAKYNETSASYSLTVNEPATGFDVTEGFTGLKWVLDDKELKGDLCDWTTSQTRRNQNSDSIVSKGVKMGAEWMNGAADKLGYIESKGAVDGGVKRIYFTWIKNSGTEANRSFTVTVGSSEDVVDLTGLITQGTYWHNFNIRENSVIRIANTSTSNFKAGPIVITPYIFYQHRADTIMASSYVYPTVYKQTLIDNTESVGTITYESDNTDAAEVNENGDVTIKAAAAEPVTITAKWQPDEAVEHYVTTSYKLLITAKQQRNAEFTNSTMTVARGETPVNEIKLGSPAGDSEPEIIYESSDNEVAVIVNNQVTTVGPGTATITAHIGETTKCLSQDITYSLTVTYAPAAGTYFTETFPNTTTTDYVSKTEHIEGRDNVYQWNMQQYRRIAGDKVGEEQGTRIRYTTSGSIEGGYIEMDGNQEGGIKEVVFNYCASGPGMEMHYFVQVGETTHDFHPTGKTVAAQSRPYAHTFNEASNTKLKIYVNTLETPQQTYPIIGEIKIVPYLLYTAKEVTVNPLENTTYINTAIIDNTPAESTITYSIVGDESVAEVDATGLVTVKKVGEVIVKASWDDVYTTYTLKVELPAPVISGLEATTIDLDGGSYTPSLTATIGGQPIEDAVFELKSSDLTKAVVSEGTTFVPVANGSANMTATLKAGIYQGFDYTSVAATAELTINAYIPEGNFVETFSNLETGESTGTKAFNGDDNVYTWQAHNYAKLDNAIVINTADGSLSSNGVQEGGVKYMTFKWIASEIASDPMGFVVTMNGESSIYHFKSAKGIGGYTWERMFNAKSNSQFSISLENGSSKGVKIMNAQITIVPYLLYTEKEATIKVGETFTNEALINNLGEETITYSIVSGSDYATIDGDEITATAEGDVVVKASWNEDQIYTTYTVHINPMSALVISENDEDLATLVEEKEGQTLDVTLQRTMVADGAYSTIFLPFAMSTTQIAAVFGEGTQVAELLSSELQDNVLTFNFDFVTEMSACVPYLIKPTQNVTEVTIEGVTIVKPQDPVTVEGGKFNGILAKQVDMDITDLYFLGDDNVLVTYPNIEKQDVQGLRAFFTLTHPTPNMVARCAVGHKLPTILPLVDGKPVAGVKKVIMNNQMVIIRNAEMYNAQGNKIQ
mgnify:CR=1 FL=1